MLFYLLGFAILAYAYTKNFKKGFMLYLCFNSLLVQNITLISAPGFPLLTLDLFLGIMLVFPFFLHGPKYQTAHMSFPLRTPLVFLILASILSMVFSVSGMILEISNTIKTMIEQILIPWIIWEILDDENDFMLVFKGLTIVFFISCLYGLFEYMIKNNPLMAYEMTLNNDPSKIIDFSYGISSRGYRIQSVFEHPIGAGINWAMYAVFAFVLSENKRKIPIRGLSLITACLCIPCIILTKMRASIFFFGIAMLSIVNLKSKKFYKLVALLLVVLILLLPLLLENINILLSFVSSSAQKAVGGSDANMRFRQLEAALELFLMSPLWGLGHDFKEAIHTESVRNLLGSESIWIIVLPSYGLMGIIAYLFLIYYSIFKIPTRIKSQPMACFAAAYWLTYTLTSVPGMLEYLYYFILFYFIKTSPYYLEKAKEGKIYGLYFKGWKVKYNRIS